MWPLRGVNKTAWSAKLILTADLVYQVRFARLSHLLMAQHCHLCLNVCFSPPTALHPPHPPPIDSFRIITAVEKNCASKTRGIQMACRISYIILVGASLSEPHGGQSIHWSVTLCVECEQKILIEKPFKFRICQSITLCVKYKQTNLIEKPFKVCIRRSITLCAECEQYTGYSINNAFIHLRTSHVAVLW